jgi:asparaginyl-tRNA synthetase
MDFFDSFIEKGIVDSLTHIVNSDFESITYTQAIDILKKAESKGEKFDFSATWGPELQTEHERFLAEKHFKRPVVVTDYPKDAKSFYMRLNDDDKTVAAMDVLLPRIGEIIGGSQREERLDVLDVLIEKHQVPAEKLWWYRELRKYGSVPHSGFGVGFERLLMYMSGFANIRDVIPFPRTPRNAKF